MPAAMYRCPCCEEEETLLAERPPPGSDGFCINCYWEDDLSAFQNPDEVRRPFSQSLNDYRRFYGKPPLPRSA